MSRADVATRLQEVRGLEATLLASSLQSERRAWFCAGFSALMSAIALGSVVFVIYRYAQPIPEHILTLNKETGVAELVSLIPEKADYDEVIVDYWLSRYIISRESYNYMDINEDYKDVGLMSSKEVGEAYSRMMLAKDGPEKTLAERGYVTVSVKSVVADLKHKTAVIRYSTTLRYLDREQDEKPRYWIATVGYDFVDQIMTVAQRRINPLGFKVTAFRRVEESVDRVGN